MEHAATDPRLVARRRMVATQLTARGIRDRRVLAAMEATPREEFVPDGLQRFALDDCPLGIGQGQTISQPYIVALCAEALALGPESRVLEVGTGSGYAAAVLSRLCAKVFTVERLPALAQSARRRLARLGYANIEVREGDGSEGWAEKGPYDGIVVAAAGPRVPRPLLRQLVVGGSLVMPVGPDLTEQDLVCIRRTGQERFHYSSLGAVRFVPLVGEAGWPAGA